MTATLSQDGVAVQLNYWTAVLSWGFVESMGQTFQAVVDSLLSDLHRSVGELDLINAPDASRIHSWNEVAPPCTASVCIHEVGYLAATVGSPRCSGHMLLGRRLHISRSGEVIRRLFFLP